MVLAFQVAVEQARARPTLGNSPFYAVLIDFDSRQPVAIFAIDPLDPKIRRLVAMTVRRDHQVLVGVVRPRRALPAGMPGSLQSPTVGFVDFAKICACHYDTSEVATRFVNTRMLDGPRERSRKSCIRSRAPVR